MSFTSHFDSSLTSKTICLATRSISWWMSKLASRSSKELTIQTLIQQMKFGELQQKTDKITRKCLLILTNLKVADSATRRCNKWSKWQRVPKMFVPSFGSYPILRVRKSLRSPCSWSPCTYFTKKKRMIHCNCPPKFLNAFWSLQAFQGQSKLQPLLPTT